MKTDPATMPAALKERDLASRPRRPLRDFVFSGLGHQASASVSSGISPTRKAKRTSP